MIGVVTGRRVSRNRDGDKNVLILQVSLIEGEDTRSIEIFSSGDFNPANGTRVYICNVSDSYQVAVATSDGLTPEVEPGEVEIYSTDNPVTQKKARLKLNKDGEIILNQGTKSAARKEDTTLVDAVTDNAFIAWISNVSAFINGLSPGTIPVVPTAVTGKINDGTDEVLLP